MRRSIFSRLMIYLFLFFSLIIGISYLALTSYFESYYTQRRIDDLQRRTHEVMIKYDQKGVDDELKALIDAYSEQGTVIQIIKTDESASFKIIKKLSASRKSDLSEKVIGAKGNESGSGLKKGQGEGWENSSSKEGHRYGLSFEEQISQQAPGKSFITILESDNQQVEWLTYKELAADGAQVTGRIPLYSVNEVIDVVRSFLLVFLSLIFLSSLIFAYFFARGISKPIIELNNIAQNMGQLEFSQKYQGKRRDEVGQLGDTLNWISAELETALSDLKAELSKEKTLEKMRQRFTATVSHEIQTPLAIIKSHAEALEDQIPDNYQERREYYQIIQAESDKVSAIASDLLDLAQMESGVYRLRKEQVSIREFLDRVLKPYQKVNLLVENNTGAKVMMDPERMEQVFNNIIGNALKHLWPEQGIIKIHSYADEKNWYTSFYNDGKNIDEKELSQIFDYFYTGASKKKGRGLGLAITRGIINCHQGQIKAENKEGGVCFLISVPLLSKRPENVIK